MANFDKIFKWLMAIEGGYVNNKHDTGGKTNYGISEVFLSSINYKKSPKDLTLEEAKKIYKKHFFDNYNINLIKNNLIAYQVFEFGVNANMKYSVKILQRAYNLINKQNKILKEDGIVGPNTAKAINECEYFKLLFKTTNIYQAIYYIGLAEKNKNLLNDIKHHKETKGSKYKHFIRGWLEKRIFDDLNYLRNKNESKKNS